MFSFPENGDNIHSIGVLKNLVASIANIALTMSEICVLEKLLNQEGSFTKRTQLLLNLSGAMFLVH